MPAMRLPFDRIAPGTFASAFPKSPATGLPAEIQGVETQAKMAMRPDPVINTTASDRVAALGRNPAPAPTGMSMTAAPMPAAPVMRPQGNPLGGMNSRPLSQRAGPMGYAPQGVGTNNPNAYAVGRNNRNFAERTGMMSPAPMPAPVMRQGPMMLGGPAVPAPVPGGMAMSPATSPTAAAPNGIDAFLSQMSQDTTAFMGEPNSMNAPAPETAPPELFAMEGAGGYVPMMRAADGKTKVAGGFYPGPAPDPNALPALPQSQEQQAQAIAKQAQQQEAMFRNQGMVPTLPKQATDAAGRSYAPAPSAQEQPFKGRVQTEGGDEVLDKDTGKMVKRPVRQYTVMQDASGKLVKRYIQDENGDSVPDPQAKEKSAPSWLDWLNTQAK